MTSRWVILAALTILTSASSLTIPRLNSKISIGDSLFFANVLLFGIPAGVITAAIDGLARGIRSKAQPRKLHQICFLIATMACSAYLAGVIYTRLSPVSLLSQGFDGKLADMFFPLVVLAFTYYVLRSSSTAIMATLAKHKRISVILGNGSIRNSVPYFVSAAAAAAIAIAAGGLTPYVLGILVPIILAARFLYKSYHKRVEEVRSLAYYDSLTGLPNRVLFKEKLEEALKASEVQKRMVAVMFLDLDHFKQINDTYGHGTGDLLLKSVASRLIGKVRNSDSERHIVTDEENIVVGRLGGDEFTVLMRGLVRTEDATRIAQRLLHSLSNPYSLNGQELSCAASIGISIYPFDGTNADSLLRNADAALYYAKNNGRNSYHLYSQSMEEQSAERQSLENRLREALLNKEFEVHYQPKLDVPSGKISGAEAFIRWRHPGRGLIKAADFIPLAEETGLVKPIGDWVLRTVFAQISAWRRDGMRVVPVSINISSLQFRQENLIDVIAELIKKASPDRPCIELELTENALMENQEEAEDSLGRLRALGVNILIDDFGTGYSSLSRLKSFKPEALKIDVSLVSDCWRNPESDAIITAIIAIASGMGFKVVAEGVENEQQVEFLSEKGCTEMQGSYFSPPVSATEFAKILSLYGNSEPFPVREGMTFLKTANGALPTAGRRTNASAESLPQAPAPTTRNHTH
jgi:diguanylate cyclase (GGDEF)-like protein